MTTPELLIATLIFSLFSAGVLTLFVSALGSWDTGRSKGESDTAASLALQKAAREIIDGKSAVVNTDGSLTVQMPRVNNQGSYDRAFNGDVVKLYLSSGTLYRQVNSNTARALAKGITSATFTVSGTKVNLAITARAQTGQKAMQTQFTQSVALRNVDTN